MYFKIIIILIIFRIAFHILHNNLTENTYINHYLSNYASSNLFHFIEDHTRTCFSGLKNEKNKNLQ